MKTLARTLVLFIAMVFISVNASAVNYSPSATYKIIDDGPGKYSYAPSSIYQWPYEYHYYCSNKNSYNIRDHVILRAYNVSTRKWGSRQTMLSPGMGWDSYHVCDPAVVKGQFNYNGTSYSLAMFYLGIDSNSSGNSCNQIGVAFSNSYTGPWIKWSGNPLITANNCVNAWGVGQPSATAVNGGRLLLFYTNGKTTTPRMVRRDINLSNMRSPSVGAEVTLPKNGLTSGSGSAVLFNNANIAYDPGRDIFIAVRPRHPFDPEQPNFISSTLQIATISGSGIWSGSGRWTVLGHLDSSYSGKPRNHNAGIMRNPWGQIISPSTLHVIHAVSDFNPDSLWSYNLYRNEGVLY